MLAGGLAERGHELVEPGLDADGVTQRRPRSKPPGRAPRVSGAAGVFLLRSDEGAEHSTTVGWSRSEWRGVRGSCRGTAIGRSSRDRTGLRDDQIASVRGDATTALPEDATRWESWT